MCVCVVALCPETTIQSCLRTVQSIILHHLVSIHYTRPHAESVAEKNSSSSWDRFQTRIQPYHHVHNHPLAWRENWRVRAIVGLCRSVCVFFLCFVMLFHSSCLFWGRFFASVAKLLNMFKEKKTCTTTTWWNTELRDCGCLCTFFPVLVAFIARPINLVRRRDKRR